MSSPPDSAPDFYRTEMRELTPEQLAALRGMQVITVAVLAGVGLFAGVALVMTGGKPGTELSTTALICFGISAVQIVFCVVLPGMMRRVQLERLKKFDGDEQSFTDQLLKIYRTLHIFVTGLLDTIILINLITYLVTSYAGHLGLAGLVTAVMVVRFPTQSRLVSWLADARQEAELR